MMRKEEEIDETLLKYDNDDTTIESLSSSTTSNSISSTMRLTGIPFNVLQSKKYSNNAA